jgi:EpsI family protein
MPDRLFNKRVWITAGLLVGALVLLHGLSHGERVPARWPLRELPRTLTDWKGQDHFMDQQTLEILQLDDYLDRVYTDGKEHAVEVYIAYYSSQRTGDTIHSPKNCLPGSGWEPMRSRHLAVQVSNGPAIVVNEYIIEKGLDRQLVLYWYQGRGRVVASEYWGKVWLVTDAITRNRTDAALVRIITPMQDGEAEARARAVKFTQVLYPYLQEFIPN